MSFWFSKPLDEDRSLPGAGGEASLAAIAEAAYRSAKHVDSVFSSERAQEDAIDRRNAAIFAETGVKLDNPYRVNARTQSDQPGRMFSGSQDVRISQYETRLQTLAQQHPEARDAIRAGTGVRASGIELARESDATLARVMESRDGFGKWGAVLAGSAAAIRHDPVQIASLGLGGELSAARTIWGAIGKTALKEALVNGASEAALQPVVQAWRKEAGLDSGFEQGLINIAMAAGIGGAFGTLAGGAQALARPRLDPGQVDQVAGAVQQRLKGAPAEALAGNTKALPDALEPVRDALPAEVRGGLDAAAIERHSAALKPARTSDPDHENAIRAMQARLDPEQALVDVPVDAERVRRLAVLETAGTTPAPKGKALTASQFVMANGGILDQGGELSARNWQGRGKAFFGKLANEDGKPLDTMREALAEAGYMTDRYGTPEEAIARSTIDDMLDLIDEDLRGNAQWSAIDLASGAARLDAVDGALSRELAERSLAAVLREGGPGLDDELALAAAKLHADGMDAGTAIERAAINLGDVKAAKPNPRTALADDFPGFEPLPDGIDDVPQRLASPEDFDVLRADELDGMDDLEFDGMPVRDIWDRLADEDDMLMLLEGCKLR